MKKLIVSVLALLPFSHAAQATQPGVFYGTIWFSSATCWIGNGKLNMLYYPANVGTNAAATTVQLDLPGGGIYAWAAHYIVPGGGSIGKIYITVNGTSIGHGDAETFQASARFTTQTPATLNTTTHAVHIVGDLKNLDGFGCDGHFDATLNSYPVP